MPAFDASAADVKVPGFVLDRKGFMSFEPDWLDIVRNGASGTTYPGAIHSTDNKPLHT